jgi:hypothetical protein
VVDGLKREALSGASFFHPGLCTTHCHGSLRRVVLRMAVTRLHFSQPRAAELR